MKQMKEQKTIGILGGMGPYATVYFYKQILDLTPVKKDWDHFRILIDSNVKIPSRTRAVLYNETSPVPDLIKSINSLGRISADFVLVPCNSAHYFFSQVAPKIDIPWLNMIELVSKCVKAQNFSRPLILGGYVTTEKRVYDKYLPTAQYLPDSGNRKIEQIIEEIKISGSLSSYVRQEFNDLIESQNQQIDSVIYACTELPIIFQEEELLGNKVFDSATIYAEEAVNYAK